MHCVVTAGPTFEPLDQVRRLTNLSTGRLGAELAAHLSRAGHEVTLLLGEQATWAGPFQGCRVERFSTTSSLRDQLRALSVRPVAALFHVAAVSDFAFGQIWSVAADGGRRPVRGGKISSHAGKLLAELVPTPKLIAELRGWYPQALLMGWKYEVDGDRATALAQARLQIRTHHTDGCVANGPAYGTGFGLLTGGACQHVSEALGLYRALELWLTSRTAPAS